MKKLTKEMKKFINSHRAFAFTVNNAGVPHVSFHEKVEVPDDRHLIVEGRCSEKCRMNLRNDPHITLTVMKTQEYSGYQISGKAEIIDAGDKGQSASGAIRITVEQVRRLGVLPAPAGVG